MVKHLITKLSSYKDNKMLEVRNRAIAQIEDAVAADHARRQVSNSKSNDSTIYSR